MFIFVPLACAAHCQKCSALGKCDEDTVIDGVLVKGCKEGFVLHATNLDCTGSEPISHTLPHVHSGTFGFMLLSRIS